MQSQETTPSRTRGFPDEVFGRLDRVVYGDDGGAVQRRGDNLRFHPPVVQDEGVSQAEVTGVPAPGLGRLLGAQIVAPLEVHFQPVTLMKSQVSVEGEEGHQVVPAGKSGQGGELVIFVGHRPRGNHQKSERQCHQP